MNERKRQIIDLLYLHGELSIQEISDLLGVSPSTVRRDLNALSQQHLVERIRGGARVFTVIRYTPAPIRKFPVDPQEARAIASRAAQLIQPRDVIGISGGQICTQLALHVRLLKGITVVTNAVNVAAELVGLPHVYVMVTGGQLNPGSFEQVGRAVGFSLNGVHIHKFFLGTDGLSLENGVTGHDEAEATAACTIMEHSDATIVLADSSKFKKANFAQVAPISAFEAIVTTDRVAQSVRTKFEGAGVRMIVVPCS